MSKLLIIVALILAFVIIKNLIGSQSRSKTSKTGQDTGKSQNSLEYEDTVQCEFCGTHIPKESAYVLEGRHYCNKAHSKEKNV